MLRKLSYAIKKQLKAPKSSYFGLLDERTKLCGFRGLVLS